MEGAILGVGSRMLICLLCFNLYDLENGCWRMEKRVGFGWIFLFCLIGGEDRTFTFFLFRALPFETIPRILNFLLAFLSLDP